MVTFSLYSPMEITMVCAAESQADATTKTRTIEVAKNSARMVLSHHRHRGSEE